MCLSLPPRLLRFDGNFDGNKVIQLWNLTFLVLIQCIFLNGGIFHYSSSPSLLLVMAHLLSTGHHHHHHRLWSSLHILPVGRGNIFYCITPVNDSDDWGVYRCMDDTLCDLQYSGRSTQWSIGSCSSNVVRVAHKSQMWFNHLNRLNVNGLREDTLWERSFPLFTLLSACWSDVWYCNPPLSWCLEKVRLQYKSN